MDSKDPVTGPASSWQVTQPLSLTPYSINGDEKSRLDGFDEVIRVRVPCKLEASYQGKILELTVNTITSTNNNRVAYIIRVF